MSSRRFKIGVTFSVLLHLSVYSYMLLRERMLFQQQSEEIEVTFVEPDAKTLELLQNHQQIVDQSDKALNDETPEEEAYLSKNNQRVVKQTRAAKQGKFTNVVGGGGSRDPIEKQEGKRSKRDLDKSKSKMPKLADLKPQFDWDQIESQGSMGLQRGVASTSDYLKDVEEGPQTLLNTREFVYYSYYSRIKSKLQRFWEPKIKEKMTRLMRSGRYIASAPVDRITQVIITLDADGILQRVQVIGESGITDLDEAAIEAFRAAAPFPNPPKGIIEPDGTVKIRWDFVLEA